MQQSNNSIWVESSLGDECLIHRGNYDKIFSNPNRPRKLPTTRFESSKVSGVVPMNSIELIQNFLDPVSFLMLLCYNCSPQE